jgi:hypothetical protein
MTNLGEEIELIEMKVAQSVPDHNGFSAAFSAGTPECYKVPILERFYFTSLANDNNF